MISICEYFTINEDISEKIDKTSNTINSLKRLGRIVTYDPIADAIKRKMYEKARLEYRSTPSD